MSVCTCGQVPEMECYECYTFLCRRCGKYCEPCRAWTCKGECAHLKCKPKLESEKRGKKRKMNTCEVCHARYDDDECDRCSTVPCSNCDARLVIDEEPPDCACGPLCGDCKCQCADCGDWCCENCADRCGMCDDWTCRDSCTQRECM